MELKIWQRNDVGGTIATPLKGLKLGASFDYVYVGSQPLTGGSRYANAAALYASFQATEKLSVHARAEYASHSRNINEFNSTTGGVFPARVFAYTATVQYDLWKNVLSRLEVRWDHSDRGRLFGGHGAFAAPTKKNDVIVAANVVYKF